MDAGYSWPSDAGDHQPAHLRPGGSASQGCKEEGTSAPRIRRWLRVGAQGEAGQGQNAAQADRAERTGLFHPGRRQGLQPEPPAPETRGKLSSLVPGTR